MRTVTWGGKQKASPDGEALKILYYDFFALYPEIVYLPV